MYSPWSGRDGIAYEDEIVYNGITPSETLQRGGLED